MQALTKEQFEAVVPHSRSLSPETKAMRELRPLTGFKSPCRWKHGSQNNQCNGGMMVKSAARRYKLPSISTRCKDGMLYVFRME